MAEMRERWRTMPRAQQLAVALLLFWTAYLGAAVYEWTFGPPGGTVPLGSAAQPLSASAAAGAGPSNLTPEAPAPADDGFPIGDLAVVLAGAFMLAGLCGVVVIAWREIRGPVRQPGMGLGDDPLWLAGDMDY